MAADEDNGIGRRALLATGAGALVAVGPAPAAPAPAAPGVPRLERVLTATVDIAEAMDLGPGALGHRRMVPILGGSFEGPRLRGTVLPGGADRQLIRRDGVRQLSALYELKTEDGAVITVLNKVLVDDRGAGPRYAFSNIELTAPEGPHGWLNDRVFVGTLGSLRPARQAVLVTIYQLV